MSALRVVLADDHEVVRAGPRVLVDRAPGMRAVGKAGDPVDGWILDQVRAYVERSGKAVRARDEWIEARRRELWERKDRLRDWMDPAAVAPRAASDSAGTAAPPRPVPRPVRRDP